MVEKISVQIALEGGQEVQRQLEGIGEAGQKAFADLAKAAEQVGGFKNLETGEVTKKLKELGVTGTEELGKIQKAVQTAVKFETLVSGVQSVETAFVALGRAAGPVGVAIAVALKAAAKATIAFSETISKASDEAVKLGLSFERFDKLRKELEKVGVSGEGAAKGLANFQKQLGEPHVDVVSVLTQAGNVIQFVGDTSNLAADKIKPFLDRLRAMPDTVERTSLALKTLGDAAGTEVIQGLRRAEGSMSAAEAKAYDLQQAIKQLSTAWEQFGSVQLAPTLTAGINVVTAAIKALGAALEQNPWGTFLQAAWLALNPIPPLVRQATKAIMELISSVTGITWDAISQAGVAAWNALTGAIGGAASAVAEFFSALATGAWDKVKALLGVGGEGSPTPGMARGGLLGGRGTGTSDSNLAWVSRGEHIMPARAVAQPGVLALLEALRRSGGNLRGVLDGMGRFALGGLVPRPAYAFAAGGAVGSMSHVTINFPGTPPISGLRASAAVVEQLQRAAALAQVRSGGRKPSRYS